MNFDDYKKLRPRLTLHPARRKLHNFDGSCIAVKETLKILVTFKGHTVEGHTFFKVQNNKSILGLDLFRALGFSVREPTEHPAVNQVASTSSSDPKQRLFDAFPQLKNFADVLHCDAHKSIRGLTHDARIDRSVVPVVQKLR